MLHCCGWLVLMPCRPFRMRTSSLPWDNVNATYATLATTNPGHLITANGVFIVTAVFGAINILLFSTLSTVASFLYNAAAGMTGGVEITLAER